MASQTNNKNKDAEYYKRLYIKEAKARTDKDARKKEAQEALKKTYEDEEEYPEPPDDFGDDNGYGHCENCLGKYLCDCEEYDRMVKYALKKT